MQYTYVGIDSHKDAHTAVFINCFFEKIGELNFRNCPSDFETFLQRAQVHRPEGGTLMFGMEDCGLYGRTLTRFLISTPIFAELITVTGYNASDELS
jgi:hypothetical protein